jgi:tetratricopeptide (TPR) repeat protein
MPDFRTLEDTHPIAMAVPMKKKKLRRWPWILLGIFVVLLFIAGGSFFGYREGIRERLAFETNQVTEQAATQFDLGVADLQAGRIQNAQARFLYVLSLAPNFPGLLEKLTEVQLAINLTKTPAVVDTPTPTSIPMTPTPDNRNQEELFTQIQQDIANKKWSDAITNLDALRKLDITYKAVQADDMYYVALRNLGIQQITVTGQLEQGLYNLALAERFGPLDYDAVGYRNWARLYLDGASFWDVDWGMVVADFQQIYKALPNLRDSSGMTAVERFRIASIKYGDQLMASQDYCKAQEQYEAALPLSNNDPNLSATTVYAKDECIQSSATPVPPATNTPEPSMTPTLTQTPTQATVEPTTETVATTEAPPPSNNTGQSKP